MTPGQWREYQRQAKERWRSVLEPKEPVIWVSTDSGALASGAARTLDAIESTLRRLGVSATVRKTAAFGTTWLEPVVDIQKPGAPRITYGGVTADVAPELLESWLVRDDPRPDLAFASFSDEPYRGIAPLKDTDWWRLQRRVLLGRCGWIDPDSIEDYVANDGYAALARCLLEMTPEQVVEEVKEANVRGRGGAGFPAGIKWESAASAANNPKFIIVNAHEGEPNVFKDRRLLEGDPHQLLEGLIIAGYAVGSPRGYVYIGSEYPLAFERTVRAVRQAEELGLLGENILGTGFGFEVRVVPGAGAYISGEASAAIYGIQGERGMPRTKPPRSAEAGLWGMPTVVNNVETLSNMPHVINNGAKWFTSLGTEKSPGTKVFSLAGDIKYVGMAELEMGCTMRDLLFVAGGGMRDGSRFRAVLAGGISGGLIPEDKLELTNEFGTLEAEGSMMGSGGYEIYDEGTCMVDVAYYCTRFNRDESCGKCVPCRIGTSSQLEMFERIRHGQGRESDIARLARSSEDIIAYSLCGLGQAAPVPILSMIRHFEDELIAHVRDKRCPAGVCPMRPEEGSRQAPFTMTALERAAEERAETVGTR